MNTPTPKTVTIKQAAKQRTYNEQSNVLLSKLANGRIDRPTYLQGIVVLRYLTGIVEYQLVDAA